MTRGRLHVGFARLVLGLVAVAQGIACADPEPLTQIVVVIDADFSGLARIEALVRGFEEPTTVRASLQDAPLPRRFALVHEGGPLGPMAVTVRAFDEQDELVLIEPRTEIHFVRGQTRLLKVDLLRACVDRCAEQQACIAPGQCVDSAEAATLVPWDGPPPPMRVRGRIPERDSGMSEHDASDDGSGLEMDAAVDARMPMDAEPDARADASATPDATTDAQADADAEERDARLPDAQPDADASGPAPTWLFEPSNLELSAPEIVALARRPLVIDCSAEIDSDDPSASVFCDEAPEMLVIEQAGNPVHDALLVVMSQLDVPEAGTLRLRGSRPVILLVEGDASIAGVIDASAEGTESGPGAERDCATGTGSPGNAGSSGGNRSGSGGGGGGYGSAGGLSGASNTTAAASAGVLAGNAAIVPLRGGCRGGSGGPRNNDNPARGLGGGGGGAVQLSVAGVLTLSGVITAGGGGGAAGPAERTGGGGGGSGGAIVIEAASASIGAAAIMAVNGGGGGGGGGQAWSATGSSAGEDGRADLSVAAGGPAPNSGGDGAAGAALATAAATGQSGESLTCSVVSTCYGGGGGGGGGVGRIRINQAHSCAPGGLQSPAASVACPACASACPMSPDLSCAAAAAGATTYFLCSAARTWAVALASCQAVGMDLVRVADAPENDFLGARLPLGTSYWLGASDSVVEGDWRWSAGNTPFWSGAAAGSAVAGAFTAWASGEPAGSGAADCGVITATGADPIVTTWSEAVCTTTRGFVCEK